MNYGVCSVVAMSPMTSMCFQNGKVFGKVLIRVYLGKEQQKKQLLSHEMNSTAASTVLFLLISS